MIILFPTWSFAFQLEPMHVTDKGKISSLDSCDSQNLKIDSALNNSKFEFHLQNHTHFVFYIELNNCSLYSTPSISVGLVMNFNMWSTIGLAS